MSFNGRSLDDLPLAAYTTGVVPDEGEEEDPDLVHDPGYTSVPAPSATTADMQHAHAEAVAAAAEAASAAPVRKRRGPSLSLRLPRLRRSKAGALHGAAPFQPVAGASVSGGFQAVSGAAAPSTFAATPPLPATRPFEPATRPFEAVTRPSGGGARRAVSRGLPKVSTRDPRVLAGGVIVVGLVLLAISMLGGSNPGAGGPGGSQDTSGAVPSAALGSSTVELTGGGTGTFTLTVASGAGAAVDNQLNATWTDPLGQALGLTGLASQGTRSTDANFVLSWTMLIDGAAVGFTSKDGECVIGMAVGNRAVHGTFVCKELESADGKHVIDFRGSYTT